MKKEYNFGLSLLAILGLVIIGVAFTSAQSQLPCGACHASEKTNWLSGRHANTQNDVAGELAANWQGQTADSVINGSAAENCVACHSPLSVTTNGGMNEVQVMGHFFTVTGGAYTDSTHAADTANWPHVGCNTCHDVPINHPAGLPTTSIFNSTSANYDSIGSVSLLCGQCHGTSRFTDTDHRIYDAWKLSRHGRRGQGDVASELASSWAGQTPNDVINGPDAENCVACHAPTAVNQKRGDTTEVMVLNRFFTTVGGVFTSSTTVADSSHWPDVDCIACHDPHRPDTLSYYNSSTRKYEVMGSPNQLCGQCHGNLRFPETDHLSYNIESGTGGIGVPDQITMPGTKCTSCHMQKGEIDGTNSLMYKGHSWSVFIRETDGSTTASCTSCNAGMNADSARAVIDQRKAVFYSIDSLAQVEVALADTFMQGVSDSVKLRYLEEAKHNLAFAESDESGGFHNYLYSTALLNDAIAKSNEIVTGVERDGSYKPARFALLQNHPNPFNPTTTLKYQLPITSKVDLRVYNLLGQVVATLVDEVQPSGSKSIDWNASGFASGLYFYRLEAVSESDPSKTFTQVKKMLLLK